MEPVARGVDVDMVMRSVTLAPFLCVGMGCVIGEAMVVVALYGVRFGQKRQNVFLGFEIWNFRNFQIPIR